MSRSGSQRIDFLRVLIAAAWADGEITYQEMNSLKQYFRRLDLSDAELAELEPYLADPIAEEEARVIVADCLVRASGKERAAVLASIRDLLLADSKLDDGEEQFLALFADVEQTTAGVFVNRLKRLWGGAAAEPEPTPAPRRSDLIDEFVRNRVLYQLKRRLQAATGAALLDADTEGELRYVCALGALLGHVAAAHAGVDPTEKQRITDILDRSSGLPRSDVEVIVDIVESEVLSDVGYYPFTRELNEMLDGRARAGLLDLLFEVAGADGEIRHEEAEEIRKISKALDLGHELYVAAKERAGAGLA